MNIKYPLESVHTLSVEEIMTAFETNAQNGIGAAEAETRTAKFGANIYAAQKQKPLWLTLLLQFKSPIVYLLLFAVAVTLYFQNYIEAIAIGVVIFVNALIGFFMELQARSSMGKHWALILETSIAACSSFPRRFANSINCGFGLRDVADGKTKCDCKKIICSGNTRKYQYYFNR